MPKVNGESKIGIFRRLIGEGKSVEVATEQSGVSKGTARVQTYKIKKAGGKVSPKVPRAKKEKKAKPVINEDGEAEVQVGEPSEESTG